MVENGKKETIAQIHGCFLFLPAVTPTFCSSSIFPLFDVHCIKLGSRLLSVYSDWSQCECLVFRQRLHSQKDFYSCCLLMGFFPLTHPNWLLLLPKLTVTFCIFVLALFGPVFFSTSDCQIWQVEKIPGRVFCSSALHVSIIAQKRNYELLYSMSQKLIRPVFLSLIYFYMKVLR